MTLHQLIGYIGGCTLLTIVTIGVLNDVKFAKFIALRSSLPVEIVVPVLLTQCIAVPSTGVIRCETKDVEEWRKNQGGTVL